MDRKLGSLGLKPQYEDVDDNRTYDWVRKLVSTAMLPPDIVFNVATYILNNERPQYQPLTLPNQRINQAIVEFCIYFTQQWLNLDLIPKWNHYNNQVGHVTFKITMPLVSLHFVIITLANNVKYVCN
ncbi:MAG: hypothetical protein GY820_13495 [Gammaproteobacteria bacterium]|nr:hypothetical protein [Gammaproteobacteria bacterium]